MKTLMVLLLSSIICGDLISQEESYFYQIPDTPALRDAQGVLARMVDGLGFRYFWATYDLREVDLAYKPTPESRTSRETMEHIHGLCVTVSNCIMQKPNVGGQDLGALDYESLRVQTLEVLEEASKELHESKVNIEDLNIVFERNGRSSTHTFWNLMNGPLADAIWHVGQVVSLRRTSGNPFPKGVSVFNGVKRD